MKEQANEESLSGKSSEDPDLMIVQSGDDASLTSIEHSQSYFQIKFARHKKKFLGIFYVLIIGIALTLGLVFGLRKAQDVERPETLYSLSKTKLPYFGSSILKGYDVCSDLQSDLEAAVKFIVDVEIDNNVRRKFHNDYGFYWLARGGRGEETLPMIMEDAESGGTEMGKETTSAGGEDSYGTNNQVEGVDEADLIKSDGEVVYAAYGDQIVIWNATSGIELSRTTLPTEDENGIGLCNNDEEKMEEASSEQNKCYMDYSWRSSGMEISSFLLHEDRLIAIASASYDLFEGSNIDNHVVLTEGSNSDNYAVLDGYHRTRVFTYNITSIPNDKSALTLLARKDLQGWYQTARSIGQEAHIVTRSRVRTWSGLEEYISPWDSQFEGLFENQYRQAAYDAVTPHIPKFAQRLASEILYSHDSNTGDVSDSECTKISKVALMLHKYDHDTSVDDLTRSLSFTDEGVLRNYVQVHSFDILESFNDNNDGSIPKVTTSHSGVFLPTASYTRAIYSSDTKMVIAGNAYSENENNEWQERTVVLAFDLSDGIAVAHSVGEVPGSVLNQFSIDHHTYNDDSEDYIRIATTKWAQFGFVDDQWIQTVESTNQVTMLKLPSNETNSTDMEVVGEAIDMGIGERIYAARFVGEVGFVVTFREIDPFYTLNLTDPTNPEVVGELKIPGFSNYLHPVNDDLILALGQDADDEGVVIGLQIAMFNVSDFANPRQTHKFVESGYSTSDAQYDHKAFRYLPESKLLIVPLSMYAYDSNDNFDGFVIYDVDETKDNFSKSFNISHEDSDYGWCWSNAKLPSRSLVFDGKVTTTKGHTVMSHDLESFNMSWSLNLDVERDEKNDDCYYWFSEDRIIFN